MRARRWWAHCCGMEDATRVIHLDLSLTGESLTGCARDDRGASQRFYGRLGLLAAIDRLIAGGAADTGEADREEP